MKTYKIVEIDNKGNYWIKPSNKNVILSELIMILNEVRL